MTKLDYSNGVQTSAGAGAEIFTERTEEGNTFLYGRYAKNTATCWVSGCWHQSGIGTNSEPSLIPLPKIEKRYANVYPNGNISVMTGEPNKYPMDRIGILAFTFRDGVPDTSIGPEWIK